jgi:hypothetical protein
MIDMSTWQELVVDVVNDLQLDPHNVRLELSEGVTEGDIVQDLFSNEKVLTLVDGIAKVGYLTHEIPIVVRRNKKLVVVEGNRRVAALKSIQNPYLAPQFQSQVTRIASAIPNRDALKKISVKLAPNDDEASQLVGAIHTGSQRRAWSPNRQAAFFHAQLEGGKSARDLIAQYPTVDVRKFILRSRFLEMFQSVAFADLELKSYVASRKFPVSTLERLYPNNDFLRILGVAVDSDYVISTTLPEDVFSALAEKVVADIKSGHINTRKLNKTTSEEYIKYLDELRDLVNAWGVSGSSGATGSDSSDGSGADSSSSGSGSGGRGSDSGRAGNGSGSSGSGTSASGAGGGGDSGDSRNQKPKPKPKPKRPTGLDTADLSAPSSFPASIGLMLAELTRINIAIYPNATMDLLRTFLEKSIKAYADSKGVDIRAHQNVAGFVYLSHCLRWLEDYLPTGGHRPLAQVVKKLASGKVSGYYSASTDALNAINHNHKVHAEAEDVRNCWSTMHELMKVVLAP